MSLSIKNQSIQSLDNEASNEVRSGIASGYVIHNRVKPKRHRFKYQMTWCLFDLDRLDHWFSKSKLWGLNKLSVHSMHNKDYINNSTAPIKDKLIEFLSKKTKQTFTGRILLFTHPRFLGYGFNSVNFYFCYQDNDCGEQLNYIVSEITNTPWGEKHLYLHEVRYSKSEAGNHVFEFDKKFHISPFVAMNMNYRWEFKITSSQIAVRMFIKQQNEIVMTVVLDTKITPFMENGFDRPFNQSFQPWKMSWGIYWQALKLWVKRIPVFDHPKHNK